MENGISVGSLVRRAGAIVVAAGLMLLAALPAQAENVAEGLKLFGMPVFAKDADELYQKTKGLSPENAELLWERACELRHVQACKDYGGTLKANAFFGDASANDRQYWAYGQACDAGDAESCLLQGDAVTPLGMFGAKRTPENYARAGEAYGRACDEHDIAEACQKAGAMYFNNGNPGYDGGLGLKYKKRACKLGLEAACA